jgi:hypothetical protein
MTLPETTMLMALIKAAYPEFYKDASDTDNNAAVAIWHKMLKRYDSETCTKALMSHIERNKYAPKISEIIENAHRINPSSKHENPTLADIERMKRLCEKIKQESLPDTNQILRLKGKAEE